MSQTRSLTSRIIGEPFKSLKAFTIKKAFALKGCVRHTGDSTGMNTWKQKFSSRNSKYCLPPLRVTQHCDLKSSQNTSQHPHISTSGHECCPVTREDSPFTVDMRRTDPLYLSMQMETLLHERCQRSDVDRSNERGQGQNDDSSLATMESDVGASAAASLSTLSTVPPDNKIRTDFDRNDGAITVGSRFSKSKHNDTNCLSHTSRPRKNRNSPYLNSYEPTVENLTSESQTLFTTPLNQSARDAVLQNGNFSHENLGVITGHPEKPEFAMEKKRRQSFEGWPSEHPLMPDDLAKAGFFYSGYSDSARCFYCNGGLRRWEEGDDVWVEHARWFPECEFLRRNVGCPFIDVVQELKKEREMITYEDVLTDLTAKGLRNSIPKDVKNDTADLDQNTAIKALIDAGFSREKVLRAASALNKPYQTLTVDLIYEELFKDEEASKNADAHNIGDTTIVQDKKTFKREQESSESLRNEIAELRLVGLCKICMDQKVSVVFLPCGHLICCQDCSYALQLCPICRSNIKGSVRAYLC